MSDAVAGQSGQGGRTSSPADRLAMDVADVVREEVRAVRGQLADAARPAGVGIMLVAAAGGCLVLGAGAASTTVLRVLDSFLPRRLAASGVTLGYVAAAVFLGRIGLAQLRAAGGSSARLAEEIQDVASATAGRVVPASAAAARDELRR